MQRDWRNPDDYAFTQDLSPELWAWQFLRRNPQYHKDYHWFISAWRELEADYGVAPNRDFSRWKLDPRAYAPEEMTQGFCEDDKSCASPDGDRVMIECAMGAKWGFYKFPNSPDVELPDVPDKLIWRETDITLPAIAGKPGPYEMDVRLDLRLPAKQQLELIKTGLVSQQREYMAHNNGWSVESLTRYLRLLDADTSGDSDISLLYQNITASPDDEILLAKQLMDGDYRLLLIVGIR